MIIDSIVNLEKNLDGKGNLSEAVQFLKNTDFSQYTPGKYPIKEDGSMFLLINSYVTQPETERQFEAHRKYIDIQYILSGKEIIFWSPVGILQQSTQYNEERDIFFLNGSSKATLFMDQSDVAIFFPWDAHKPNCIWDEETEIRKAVLKIAL